ncbi:NIPSNAP family protein [Pontibacter chitinilyticus]|uniref:NIPSNAP family protein n=1 Tax=Pontibacter chitinilyticus TaxID=2674989 RepID=UPI00321AA424
MSLCLLVLCLVNFKPASAAAPKASTPLFALKVYHLSSASQEERLDQYLKQAYLPALHRAGINKVGVFKPVVDTTAATSSLEQLVYVFVPFNSQDQFFKLDETLAKDKQYQTAGKDFLAAAQDKAAYNRYETILLGAFSGMPEVHVPKLSSAPGERIYELRSYESPTDERHENKVSEFNVGEIKLFNRLGFNAVFYADVLAGSKMPNLMYMTSFENRAAREAHWKTFNDDPEWKQLNGQPRYAKNVSHADIILLHNTDYSDI